jgi:hypothetical protein
MLPGLAGGEAHGTCRNSLALRAQSLKVETVFEGVISIDSEQNDDLLEMLINVEMLNLGDENEDETVPSEVSEVTIRMENVRMGSRTRTASVRGQEERQSQGYDIDFEEIIFY